MTSDNDTLVRDFVEAFNTKDSDQLVPYLHPDVVFHAYGDNEVHGRDAVVAVWRGVRPDRVRDGAAWRDYSNPAYATELLNA